MQSERPVPKRILTALIASLSAGVVPRTGTPYIAIGRGEEITAMLSDLERVSEGGGSVRFLIGRYGSGKSFLMQLIRGYALERGFVCADVDLSPERRLYGTSGTGLATYRELIKNMATKSSPDGGGLTQVLAKLIFDISSELRAGGLDEGGDGWNAAFGNALRERLRSLESFVGGYDFVSVITHYYAAVLEDDDRTASACLRWLRGEYSGRTEARDDLGFRVSGIIGDAEWYDCVKLWAELVSGLGYRGLVLFIDECVNLYKITHRIARENNYEKILSIFNDTLQGRAPHLGIVFGGTPQFLEDRRRGLFSYEALHSRLNDSRYEAAGFRNLSGPVIRLTRLSDDELLALLLRVTTLYGMYTGREPRITPEERLEFLNTALSRAGATGLITPREMLRDYMTLLAILDGNPGVSYRDVAGRLSPEGGHPGEGAEEEESREAVTGGEKGKFDPADIDF